MPTLTLGFSLTGPAPAASSSVLTYRGVSAPARIELTGAQTYEIDLAMMPAAGLKGLLVQLDPLDAAGNPITNAVTITWTSNSIQKSEELSAGTVGGFLALCSPSPTDGITALSITSAADCVVHVAAIG